MRRSETQLLAGIGVVLQFLLGSSLALAQAVGETRTIDIIVEDHPRPMLVAVGKIVELSGIPIHYEDMRVYYSGDFKDITAEWAQRRPVPEGVRVMGPRGGQLSVPIEVDAATGRLTNLEAVNTALAAIVSAYNARDDLPGDFEVESRNGVFFVQPVRYRDASGATQPMTPILSTPITFPEETRSVRQTLRLIQDQVSAATGVEITPNIMSVVARDVTIGAQDEPAYHLIARILASRNGAVPAADASWDSSFSYRLLCDNRTGCGLNDRRSRPTETTPRTPRRRDPPPPIIPPGQGTNTVP